MAEPKNTIYIDIDDDITAIIDKLDGAKAKIVALVLPKRATVLQSQVNMKLLKRAADDAKKDVVLVTAESGLLPLAGAAGLHVATTLSSKPEIPGAPPISEDNAVDVDETAELPIKEFDARSAEDKPIGEVAETTNAPEAGLPDGDTIELDNSDKEPEPAPVVAKPKKGKDKKKKIPNFNRFRNGIVIGILVLIGLGVLFYFALEVWPHATVKIYTSQTPIPTNFVANMSTNANKVEPADEIMPAVAQTEQKSYSQTVPATGQKDEGTPAAGNVTMTAEKCGGNPFIAPPDIPSGTGVSTNNLTYITQADTSFSGSGFQNGCYTYTANSETPITAQGPGTNYNVSNATFSVSSRPDVTATGSASGGTSNVVRVVQQSDIDSAKSQLKGNNNASIKQILQSQLQKAGLTAIPDTFAALPSNVDASANAGDQADNVTVTENVTYVMYGYRQSDMQQLIKANIAQQFNSAKQGVLSYGLSGSSFKLNGTPTTQAASVGVKTTVIVGPKLDKAQLIKQVAGKKAGDIRRQLQSQAGVSKVQVNLSPFWVGSVPNDPSKISIEFVKNPANG